MQILKTVLLASALVAGGGGWGSAQSNMNDSSGATSTPSVSAQTHCRDASGKVQLKNAGGAGSVSGSQSGGGSSSTVGSSASSSPGVGAASGGSVGTGSKTSTAANLPSC
jgi:hypothetical protein